VNKIIFFIGIAGVCICSFQARAQDRGSVKSKEKATYSTNLDFDSTMIDGQKKAPLGFFLQGRNKQSLTNMVKLRRNFKRELRRSRTAVKAMVR
tara:strand:- start:1476 stop:1757 length:282 start_codon:yes stop_codon:yes gene_type:complete